MKSTVSKSIVKPFERRCRAVSNDVSEISIDQHVFEVPYHPFWVKFASGWEPDTERIFRSYIRPESTVLDIGAWIGPTILLALACGAEGIVALEPNPHSYFLLKKMINMNSKLADRVVILNKAIDANLGTVTMGLVENETDTSTSSIAGNDFIAETITLQAVREKHHLDQIDLIKIDIEGAESLLVDDLISLGRQGQTLHLSIHVPFFPDDADKSAFADALDNFTVYDDRGQKLDGDRVRARLTTAERYPEWGTQHGNFFELLLIGKRH